MNLLRSDIAIIGAGPVGLFTVFQAGMLGFSSIVIDSLGFLGGQCAALYPQKPIYDIPGFKLINGLDLVRNLEEQASAFDPRYLLDRQVKKLYRAGSAWHLETSKGDVIEAKVVIIACGVGAFTDNRPPINGIEAFEGSGVLYNIKDISVFHGKDVVIAGGGDSALDWAVEIAEVASSLSIVHRRDKFRALPATVSTVNKLVKKGKIKLFTHYQLYDLCGVGNSLEIVKIQHLDGNVTELKADFMMPFFGMKMELGPILDWGLEIEKNHITVLPSSMQTNLSGVFAIGDICYYPGKLKLILTGFSEAALACHSAYNIINPEKPLHFEYSTTKGVLKL